MRFSLSAKRGGDGFQRIKTFDLRADMFGEDTHFCRGSYWIPRRVMGVLRYDRIAVRLAQC